MEEEQRVSSEYSSETEFSKVSTKGRALKSTSTESKSSKYSSSLVLLPTGGWNDSASQLSDSDDEANLHRYGDKHSMRKSSAHRSTVRRDHYNMKDNRKVSSRDMKMHSFSTHSYRPEIHSRLTEESSLLHLDMHEADTSSVLVHATESVAGDIDTRSVSSLHLSSGIAQMDHDIMIHLEYPESTGSITSDHKETESIEHLSLMSRGRTESIGGSIECLSERSAILVRENTVPLPDPDYFPSTMSYKSDIATVCSGSVIEDIEICSVFSNEMTSTTHPTMTRVTSQTLSIGTDKKITRKYSFSALQKHDRSVEFSLDSMGNPSQRVADDSPFFQTFPRLNTMGPPLNRSILLSSVLTGDGHSSFEIAGSSRPGSVKSFASDNVFVDTDDCGGSIVESESRASFVDEHQSVHSHEHIHSSSEMDKSLDFKDPPDSRQEPTDLGQLQNLVQGINGRVSPGGTIYKGRGVRKYQGRYMNLPLKRFYQSTDAENQSEDYCETHVNPENLGRNRGRRPLDNSPVRRSEWARRPSYAARSRSRSRDRGDNPVNNRNSWRRSRSQSCSPPVTGNDRDVDPRSISRKCDGNGWKRNGNRSHHVKHGGRHGRRPRNESDGRANFRGKNSRGNER